MLTKFVELFDNKKKYSAAEYSFTLGEKWLNTEKIVSIYPATWISSEDVRSSKNLSDLSKDVSFTKIEYEAGGCIQSFITIGRVEDIAKVCNPSTKKVLCG